MPKIMKFFVQFSNMILFRPKRKDNNNNHKKQQQQQLIPNLIIEHFFLILGVLNLKTTEYRLGEYSLKKGTSLLKAASLLTIELLYFVH